MARAGCRCELTEPSIGMALFAYHLRRGSGGRPAQVRIVLERRSRISRVARCTSVVGMAVSLLLLRWRRRRPVSALRSGTSASSLAPRYSSATFANGAKCDAENVRTKLQLTFRL